MAVVDGFVLVMWFLGCAALVGSVGYRMYNLLNAGRAYGWDVFWINFSVSVIGFGLVFISNMLALDLSVSLFSVLMTWIFIVGVIMFLAELLYKVGLFAREGMAYNSLEESKKSGRD